MDEDVRTMGGKAYQLCSRCVMDTSDPGITFDVEDVCIYCRLYDREIRPRILVGAERDRELERIVAEIKAAGRRRPYDSILGLSGGLDSSYLAYLAWKLGLRPLVVHLDNSWDSELAVKNVENIVKKTGFDYYNLVVDWEEFKDVQVAYLKASVLDTEVVSDHAIFATMYRVAARHGIRYILSGENYSLEGALSAFCGWNYIKQDLTNLRAIHSQYGNVPLKTYPTMSLHRQAYYENVRRIRRVRLLDCVDYRRDAAIHTLAETFGWRYYGDKHYESVFTKFYQAHILPKKFGLDKRRIHLSSLIQSDQMTRERAIRLLEKPLYVPEDLKNDTEYFAKKLGLSDMEFREIMARPPVPHSAFPVERVSMPLLFLYAVCGFVASAFLSRAEWRESYWTLLTVYRAFRRRGKKA